MTMSKITINDLKNLAKQYDLHVCRIKGKEVVKIRKNPSDKYVDIPWDAFEKILKKKVWLSIKLRKVIS